MKIIWVIIMVIAATIFPSLASQIAEKNNKSFTVKQVHNGKSFTLNNGKTVRLASIQVPNIQERSGLKRPGQPMGTQSHQALIDLIQNKQVSLQFGPEKEDRKGRWVAIASLADGRIVQEEMISEGWAITYPFPDLREPLPKWLKLEEQARNAGHGIWQNSYWDPQSSDGVDTGGKERYLLVEGVVKKAAKVKDGWFLNFDENWKTDFTGVISKEDTRAHFKKYDVKSLEGKRVRLRGWTYRYNGPAMDIHQPEQIEVLN